MMRKLHLIIAILFSSFMQLYGQNLPTQLHDASLQISFKNTPVLFKEHGKLYQQVIATCPIPAEITLSSAINGRPFRNIVEVNTTGKQIGAPLTDVKLRTLPGEIRRSTILRLYH